MNNNERLALANRVQKRIQKQLPHYQFISKRDEIEKEFNNKRVVRKTSFSNCSQSSLILVCGRVHGWHNNRAGHMRFNFTSH